MTSQGKLRQVGRTLTQADTGQMDELLLRASLGENAAFDEFTEKFSGYFYAVCRRVMWNHEETLDALQEGLLAVFKGLHTYRAHGNPKAWACRILVRTALHLRKRRARWAAFFVRSVDERDLQQRDELGVPADESCDIEALTRVRRAVTELPDPFRQVITLRFINGCTFKEAAAALGLPLGTVSSRQQTAVHQLQEALLPTSRAS